MEYISLKLLVLMNWQKIAGGIDIIKSMLNHKNYDVSYVIKG
jgi:hypothetical protein